MVGPIWIFDWSLHHATKIFWPGRAFTCTVYGTWLTYYCWEPFLRITNLVEQGIWQGLTVVDATHSWIAKSAVLAVPRHVSCSTSWGDFWHSRCRWLWCYFSGSMAVSLTKWLLQHIQRVVSCGFSLSGATSMFCSTQTTKLSYHSWTPERQESLCILCKVCSGPLHALIVPSRQNTCQVSRTE